MQFQEGPSTHQEADYYAKQAGPVGSPAYNKVQAGHDRYLEADLSALANQKP